ncbi:MAG: hypothetical protein ACL7AY_14080 [Candidatus Arsenophonus phytopathogenicus]
MFTPEESLSVNIDKTLTFDINDTLLKDEESTLPENTDGEKLMNANDEVNILHHADKQKIKEKEYGD